MSEQTEVQYHRQEGYVFRLPVISGAVCHGCGSGEVVQPMQNMDMPMTWKCLRCGLYAPTEEFDRAPTGWRGH